MSGLKLRFSRPEHGWLELSVTQGHQLHQQTVSDVPCDSLTSLGEAALGLLRGEEPLVEWSLEPDFETWQFRAREEAVVLHIQPGPGSSLEFSAPRASMAVALWRGLAELQSRWPESGGCWSHPFPTRLTSQLKTAVRGA